jgi:RNA polymerase sigma-70 factor, ECF subfamily
VSESVESAYRTYYRDVYRFVLALTHSPDEAEEIVAETFERALRNWRRVPEPPLPWLLLTARRIATDRWRRAQRWTRIRLGVGTHSRPDVTLAHTEFRVWLSEIARVISKRQREVLFLRYQRDLTDSDIATILGITESGVRSLASRALEALRAHEELL